MSAQEGNGMQPDRVKAWQEKQTRINLGLLLYLSLTGLAITFIPFGSFTQYNVLAHTVVGLAAIAPLLIYLWQHWKAYLSQPLTHMSWTGYIGVALFLVLLISGLVLTWQSLFGTRITYGWSQVHLWLTFGLLAALLPHYLVPFFRTVRLSSPAREQLRAAQRGALWTGLAWCAGLTVPILAAMLAYSGIRYDNQLPPDYRMIYGKDRPFAPSLAVTASGGAYDERSFSGSESCGTSGCHEQIVKEWLPSAHRYSSMDVAFQAVQKVMAQQNGPESTRYCGGCHDPISLFSGAKSLLAEDLSNEPGVQEGVSCLVCHSVKQTDVKGNANYTISQPRRYLFEEARSKTALVVRDFLIRAYPKFHVASLSKRLFKTPEYCAACHKQFIDKEVNRVGWVQLQNQYDNWRMSRWNHPGDPRHTIECRECHMPLVESRDPAAGDDADYNRGPNDGRHRSHRFLAANQFIPRFLKLEGAEQHVQLTEKWLRGQIDIPEIQDKWTIGPAVSVELIAPYSVRAGDDLHVQIILTSRKVGHDFPTGPLDIIQSWVDLSVTDANGTEIFRSGALDQGNMIQPGSFLFKAEAVDRYGNLIDRHNLWEMVGVRYRRSLFPGFADTAEFSFPCSATVARASEGNKKEQQFKVPGKVTGPLQVHARLLYRKIDQFLLNFLFGADKGYTAPVTVMSEDQTLVQVTS